MTETELLNTPDAQVWAMEFVSMFGITENGTPLEVDAAVGLMIGWFANAMTAIERLHTQSGCDVARRKA